MPDTVTTTLEECKDIIVSVALADNLGDAKEALGPLLRKVGLTPFEVNMDALRTKDFLPEYLKD